MKHNDTELTSAPTPPATTAIRSIKQREVPTWNGGVAPILVIEYSIEEFRSEFFVENGVVCPPNIQRSVRKRQAEFYFGRLAASQALAQYGLSQVEVQSGKFREPIWPVGIVGSITHQSKFAAAVVLDQQGHAGIGIDIESIIQTSMQDAMFATVVSATEVKYLRSLTADLTLNTLLSVTFSAKESFFKATFNTVGRYFDFDMIEVIHIDLHKRSIAFVIQQTLCKGLEAGTACFAHFELFDTDTVFTSYSW